jgi:hypothetical protein
MTTNDFLLVCLSCWTGIVIGTCVRDFVRDDRDINILRGLLVVLVVTAGIFVVKLGEG